MTIDVYKDGIKKLMEKGEEVSPKELLKVRRKYFLSVCNYFCDNYVVNEDVKARIKELIQNPKGLLYFDFKNQGISAGAFYAFCSWADNPDGNEIQDFYNEKANALSHVQTNMMNDALKELSSE